MALDLVRDEKDSVISTSRETIARALGRASGRCVAAMLGLALTGAWFPAAVAHADTLVPDDSFRACLNTALRQAPAADVTADQLAGLTGVLACDGAERNTKITSIAGAEHLTGVETLVLANNHIADVTPLAGLTQLVDLELNGNQVASTQPLANLAQLELLDLRANKVDEVLGLGRMAALKEFYADGNQIADITPLVGAPQLRKLWLGHNKVVDLAPLAHLTGLEELSLENNAVADVTPLAGLAGLQTLYIEGNGVTDLTPLPAKLTPATCDAEQVCAPHVFASGQDAALSAVAGVPQPLYIAGAPGASTAPQIVVYSGRAEVDQAAGQVTYVTPGLTVLKWTSPNDNGYFSGQLAVTVTDGSSTPTPTPSPSETPSSGTAGPTESTTPTSPAPTSEQPIGPLPTVNQGSTPVELPTSGTRATLDEVMVSLALFCLGLGALGTRLLVILPVSSPWPPKHAA
ncbi:MAG: leucine-rich repeat domain-containing protein [Propionibacteriaceae bacterium]|jgi:hypothetical protein|nr:leucine-rich repeat domain-containing protein [Propionibacteriaceae bacterium]